jgi:hypothetical protein
MLIAIANIMAMVVIEWLLGGSKKNNRRRR